jgi:sec-independent protein translocase protein TatA
VIGDIIQPTHLIFILVVALLVLGPKRLPEVGRSLGRGIRDFRDAMTNSTSEARELIYGEHALGGDHTPTGQPPATSTATSPLTSSATLAPEPAPAATAWEPPEFDAATSVSTAWSEHDDDTTSTSTSAAASAAASEPAVPAWSKPTETAWSKPTAGPATSSPDASQGHPADSAADAASQTSVAEPVYGD